MKQSKLYGAMALGLLFASCSSDDIIQNVDKTLETDQDFYVSLRISGDLPTTRAAADDGTPVDEVDETDFAGGTGTESTVKSAYFVFYDADGNVIGDVTPIENMSESDWKTDVTDGTVEKYYKSVIKVSVMKGEKAPTQVICYINPVNPGNLNKHLNEIQTLQLEEAVKGGNTFPMSNSVYYASDTAETPSIAVPLTMGTNLFETENDAEKALAKNDCANIYVERYATKLSFDATAAEQTDFVTGQRVWDDNGVESETRNKITLHFDPQYWAVNAESKYTYVIKSFRKQAEDGAILPDNYSYTGLNDIINNGIEVAQDAWKWNNAEFNRSYWGMSPAYFTDKYPEVSSDLDPEHSELQKYISYNELLNREKGFDADNTTAQYFKETTVGSLALASRNPAAAVASVIYVGKYQLKLNDGAFQDDIDFYTYLSGPVPDTDDDVDAQPYIYFGNTENTINSSVTGGESILKRMLIQCTILFKQNEDGKTYSPYELGNGTGFGNLASILDVSELTAAEKKAYDGSAETVLKLQHNARTLRFKSVPTAADNIYILTYDGYKQIVDKQTLTETEAKTQMTLTAANVALARNVGYALYYTSGHAYFNIPVKHFGWYRNGNPNKDAGTINWNDVRVGDFGMVRNHAYQITVGEIKGLASGIGGDDVEIVPPSFTQSYYMSYNVNILKWAIVPAQGVDL